MLLIVHLCIAEMTCSSFDLLILSLLGKKLTGLHLEPFYALSLCLEQIATLILLPIFHPALSVSYCCDGLLSRVFDLSPLFELLFLFFGYL